MNTTTCQTLARHGIRPASLIAVAALLLSASHLTAGVIYTGVTATTDMGSFLTSNLANTLNGSGLTGTGITATHGTTLPGTALVQGTAWLGNAVTGSITFDLGSGVTIDAIYFWNQNYGPAAYGSSGIQNVTISTSTDGLNFAPLPGAPTSFSKITSYGALAPEVFTFAPITAKNVRFDVGSNYGDPEHTGFGEVQFANAPEPSSIGILGAGVLAFMGGSRKRRSR